MSSLVQVLYINDKYESQRIFIVYSRHNSLLTILLCLCSCDITIVWSLKMHDFFYCQNDSIIKHVFCINFHTNNPNLKF